MVGSPSCSLGFAFMVRFLYSLFEGLEGERGAGLSWYGPHRNAQILGDIFVIKFIFRAFPPCEIYGGWCGVFGGVSGFAGRALTKQRGEASSPSGFVELGDVVNRRGQFVGGVSVVVKVISRHFEMVEVAS